MSSKRLRNVSRPDNGSTSTEYFPKKKKVDNEQTAKYNEDENFLILEQQTLEHINFPKVYPAS